MSRVFVGVIAFLAVHVVAVVVACYVDAEVNGSKSSLLIGMPPTWIFVAFLGAVVTVLNAAGFALGLRYGARSQRFHYVRLLIASAVSAIVAIGVCAAIIVSLQRSGWESSQLYAGAWIFVPLSVSALLGVLSVRCALGREQE